MSLAVRTARKSRGRDSTRAFGQSVRGAPPIDIELVGRVLGNVPPVNTLYKGDYSQASRTPTRPPFERWWADGAALPV